MLKIGPKLLSGKTNPSRYSRKPIRVWLTIKINPQTLNTQEGRSGKGIENTIPTPRKRYN